MTIEERNDAIEYFKEVVKKEVDNAKHGNLAIEALKQQLNEDCVSRMQAVDTIHKTIYGFFDVSDNESMNDKDKFLLVINKAISNAIKKLPSAAITEPSDDCISRKAVLHEIPVLWNSGGDKDYCMESLQDFVAELPPITQQPKMGRWINTKEISISVKGQILHEVVCSECSGISFFRAIGKKYIGANLCPNCGAKMEGVE